MRAFERFMFSLTVVGGAGFLAIAVAGYCRGALLAPTATGVVGVGYLLTAAWMVWYVHTPWYRRWPR